MSCLVGLTLIFRPEPQHRRFCYLQSAQPDAPSTSSPPPRSRNENLRRARGLPRSPFARHRTDRMSFLRPTSPSLPTPAACNVSNPTYAPPTAPLLTQFEQTPYRSSRSAHHCNGRFSFGEATAPHPHQLISSSVFRASAPSRASPTNSKALPLPLLPYRGICTPNFCLVRSCSASAPGTAGRPLRHHATGDYRSASSPVYRGGHFFRPTRHFKAITKLRRDLWRKT